MQPESQKRSADLRHLLSRAAEAASYSGKKMMESAGLSWQSLAAWKAGTRTPRAESVRAVGHALLLRGDRICRIGHELILAAEQASGQGMSTSAPDDGPQGVLFAPAQTAGLNSTRLHDDGAEGPHHQEDGSGEVSTATGSSERG